MALSDIVQRKIAELLTFVVTGEKVEVGKSAVAYLRKILPEIKGELRLDFDEFEIHPGPHPRDTADIELIKNNAVIQKITVKTAVSADIKATIRRMQIEKRRYEDGLLIFGLYCVKGDKKDKVLGLILIPRNVLYSEAVDAIYEAILGKVEEKKRKENYDEISIVAMNESIILETATAVIANKKAIEDTKISLNKRIDTLENRMNQQFDNVQKQFDGVQEQFKDVYSQLKNIYSILERLNDNIDKLTKRSKNKK